MLVLEEERVPVSSSKRRMEKGCSFRGGKKMRAKKRRPEYKKKQKRREGRDRIVSSAFFSLSSSLIALFCRPFSRDGGSRRKPR
jgi:hypothetical protein